MKIKSFLAIGIVSIFSIVFLSSCGHNHTEATREINLVSPSCTVDGSYTLETYCIECNEIISDEIKVIPALGHNFTNYVSNNDATCSEDGTKTGICDREGCGATNTIVDIGTKLGHIFTTYVSNNDATC